VRALLVSFNFPFDVSRVAFDFTIARYPFAGGLALQLWSYPTRPVVNCQTRTEPGFVSNTLTVVPVNSQQVDKLRVVVRGSFSFRTRSNGRFRLPWRLVSRPEGSITTGPTALVARSWTSGTQPGSCSGQRPQTPVCRLPCGEEVCTWRLAS